MDETIVGLVRDYARAKQALCRAIGGRSVEEGIGEWIACNYYRGRLAPSNTRAFDVVAPDGRSVQAKARTAVTAPQFEHNETNGFDVSLCLWLSKDFEKVRAAWEITPETLARMARYTKTGVAYVTEPQLRGGGP